MTYPKNIVAVTLGGERWEKCQDAYPGVIPFWATNRNDIPLPKWIHPEAHGDIKRFLIPKTYQRLAPWLIGEGAGLDTLIIQDDVRFSDLIPDYTRSTIFGRLRPPAHLCPQAFSFEHDDYYKLANAWDGKQQICEAWWRVIQDFAIVPIASDEYSD